MAGLARVRESRWAEGHAAVFWAFVFYGHCTARWLNQAGVDTDHLPLGAAGIEGNAHEMMPELNGDGVIASSTLEIRDNLQQP